MLNDSNEERGEDTVGKRKSRTRNGGKRLDRRTFLAATGTGTAAAVTGCLGGGGGGVGDTVTIGAMGPADSPFGASILNTAELAAEQMNANDGIAGADVEVITKDTKDDPATTRSVYQELTTGENVDFTVGLFGSENLLAIMPNIAQQETLHISTGAATPESTRKVSENYEKFKYYFRTGALNSVFLGRSMVTFAKNYFEKMGWEKVAILAEDYKWTEPVSEVLGDQLNDVSGVEVVSNKRVAQGTKDFNPVYDEFENKGVDGAYTVLAHTGSASLVQWKKQQRPFGYGGIHVPAQLPSYYDAVGGAAEAVFSQNTATPNVELTEKTQPYVSAYEEKFGKYPVYDGYSTQDAMYMFKNAVEEAGTTDSAELISPLEQMSYTGTAGTVEFYGKDHEFTHDLKYGPEYVQGVFFQWQDGDQRTLWPENVANSSYKSPPWL